MKVNKLNESILSLFKNKQTKPAKMSPLTDEQRKMIDDEFPNSNAFTTYGGGRDSEYVLPYNVNAKYGKGALDFRNENGTLIANVSYYGNKKDVLNTKMSPLTSKDSVIKSIDDLKKLKIDLDD